MLYELNILIKSVKKVVENADVPFTLLFINDQDSERVNQGSALHTDLPFQH